MAIKIAFIGAGSIGFTRKLLTDILSVEELRDVDIRFMDIDQDNLNMVTQLCQRDIISNGLDIQISATLNRRNALADADYVINTVRIGGLEAFTTDVEIPMKYGVNQCVGDTLCAGGIMYGQRGVAFMIDLCKDIREVASNKVLMLNYANPNAMMTWAANKYGKVNTIGLCHGVQGGHKLISEALDLPQEDVDIIGISSLGYDHVLVPKLMKLLRSKKLDDVHVIVGGIIPTDEIPDLKEAGVGEVFCPGTKLDSIVAYVRSKV